MENLVKPEKFRIYSNLAATCMENKLDTGYYYYVMMCAIGNSGWVTRKDFILYANKWFGKSKQHLSSIIKKYDGEFWTYYPKHKTIFYKGIPKLCKDFMVKGTDGARVEYDIEYLSTLKKFRSAIYDSLFVKITYKQTNNPNSNNNTGKQISKIALRKKLSVECNRTLRGYEKIANIYKTTNYSAIKIVNGKTGELIISNGPIYREDGVGQWKHRIKGDIWLISQLPNSYFSTLGDYIPHRPKYNSGDELQGITGRLYYDSWKQVKNRGGKAESGLDRVYVRSKNKLRTKNSPFGAVVHECVFI